MSVDGPTSRMLTAVGGFVLAIGATLAVLLTDNPQLLKLAVVAVAWAFVLATFAVGRRSSEREAAAAREAELRATYERELEREVVARREYELELENELRREAQEAMSAELDALRGDLGSLSALRAELARMADLRGDLTALTALRDDVAALTALRDDVAALSALRGEVARVAALREDVAALNSLRGDLGQLADLRADMGRLRAELTEQLSSEMLVERIVMRTQANRMSNEPVRLEGAPRTLESAAAWSESAPRELTGGWPAIRLDEPPETRQAEQVLRPGAGERPAWADSTAVAPGTTAIPAPVLPPSSYAPPAWSSPGPAARTAAPAPAERYAPPPPPSSAPRPTYTQPHPATDDLLLGYRGEPTDPGTGRPSRHAAEETLSPAPPTSAIPEAPLRRRRYDESAPEPLPPVPGAASRAQSWSAPPAPEPVTAGADPDRLARILAENGVAPAGGGRRRRRYRDEDATDDVLARVLGRE